MKKRKRPELRIERAARWLEEAHARRERFRPLPPELAPASAEEAYAIQDEFVALRAQRLGPIAGYKVALTTPAMRRFVGVDTPFAGAMLESTLLASPAAVRAGDYVRLVVEFEIGIRVAEDFPAADAPYGRAQVVDRVGGVLAALELADDRDADYATLKAHPLDLAADNAWNEGAVLGAEVTQWGHLDLASLRGVASVSGRRIGEGKGADALGHPLDAVAWVANHLASLGRALLRDEVVITGSLVASHMAKAGERVRFELEGVGAAELSVE